MSWFWPTERERWRSPLIPSQLQRQIGLPALDARARALYGEILPRGVNIARLQPDRPALNRWMSPQELAQYAYLPGQIILGKFANRFLGYLDDRPQVTIAGARAGKTSTVLEPNLYLYPGSMLVLDPKGELSHTAMYRRLLGHQVFVLAPFGDKSANFNPLAELDHNSRTIVDDARTVTQALVIDDGDARSKHWTDNARALMLGIVLLTLLLPEAERNIVTVRELLSLTHPRLLQAVKAQRSAGGEYDEGYYNENMVAVETLLGTMTKMSHAFGGILAAIGNRFLNTPKSERGSIFSTASAQTDFLDSLPLRDMSRSSDFKLSDLRGDRPVTIYLCLPVGRMESHYRWLRLVVQLACIALERLGTYPRDRPPILYLMEEFASLGHMEIMERAAAYFPGFGIKLWAVLQDIGQLERYYRNSWQTFVGNAGLVQCFANGDRATLDYVADRLQRLMAPFELRTAFSRKNFSQLLMLEGEPPAAALRLEHEDVSSIREQLTRRAAALRNGG